MSLPVRLPHGQYNQNTQKETPTATLLPIENGSKMHGHLQAKNTPKYDQGRN